MRHKIIFTAYQMKTCVLILGHGPSAISAAIYLSRAKIPTLLIGKKEESQLNRAKDIQNYFGFENPINGRKLLEAGLKQAKKFGTQVISEKAKEIIRLNEGFIVKTDNLEIAAEYLILAIGLPVNSKALISQLKLKMDKKVILVDKDNKTNIPKIFAIGCCSSLNRQLSRAIGDGCNAAFSIIKTIKKKDLYYDYGSIS